MTKLNINYKTNTIEMSESFNKAASIFNSKEYLDLIQVRNAFPTFTVEIVKNRKNSNAHQKGLTLDYIKSYVARHQNGNSVDELNKLLDNGASYFAIKNWFINSYPTIKDLKTKTALILAD